MKTTMATILLVLTFGTLSGLAGIIQWGTSERLLFERDEETLLPAATAPAEAGFIQLIWLGESGLYEYNEIKLDTLAGDGTMGEDLVIGKSWVGDGGAPFFLDGIFTATDRPSTDPYASGQDNFAVRVFDTPSPDWDAGLIPLTGYYNYVVFEGPVKDVDDRFTLVINAPLATVLPVPEPASLLLIGLAGLALLGRGLRG